MKNSNVKDLTIGALFAAIYGVLYILIQTVFIDTESIMYYILPLPIAIYTSWKGYKKGLLVLAVSIALEFIIQLNGLFLFYSLLITPCLLVGFIYGMLKGKVSNIITIVLTFMMALIANFISLWAFELINNISYYQMTVSELNAFISVDNFDSNLISTIIWTLIPIVFTFDAIVKVIFLEILMILFMKRLHINENLDLSLKFKLSPVSSLIEILLFVLSFIFLFQFGKNSSNMTYVILYVIVFSLLMIFSVYMAMTSILYLSTNIEKKSSRVIFGIVGILLMPIFSIIGIVINFKRPIEKTQ